MKLAVLYDGTLFECQMIKNLLENEGIESMLKDEVIGTRGGYSWRPAGSVKLLVLEDDFEFARQIVEQFEKSRQTD